MISAFGVDHGLISKGLPRYLKNIEPVIASQKRTFKGGTPMSRDDYVYLRTKAHTFGREASKKNAEWKKGLPKKPEEFMDREKVMRSEQRRQAVVIAGNKGRLARVGSQNALIDNSPIVRPKKPRKPRA